MQTRPSRLHTWLQLFRAPNLFTVPGDPLAGFLLANSGFVDHTIYLIVAASIAFYAAGLLQNDLADLEEDRAERPNRPLPSGAAEISSVRATAWGLNIAGLALCGLTGSTGALIVGVAIVAAVTSYNRWTKSIAVLGALNMGLCRALSVLLGGFAGPLKVWQLTLLPLVVIGLYIAAVTNLARHETKPRVPLTAWIWPGLVVLLGAFGGIQFALTSPAQAPAAWIFGLAVIAVAWLAFKGLAKKTPLPPLIGGHIRVLLILQAALCYLGAPWGAGPYLAALFLVLWPVSARVSRRFYAS